MSSNDYIIITESHDLSDDKGTIDETTTPKEGEESTRRMLEGQGIFLDQEGDETVSAESSDDFSKKLQELGGIEIIQNEDTDTDY